jgi:metal-dependent hydrolase (beta-lactamase superfamily II)
VTGQNIFFHSGGTHLQNASEKKITATVEKLKALNVTQVSPSHCSAANRVQKTFKVVYGTNYIASRLGEKVPLEPASK